MHIDEVFGLPAHPLLVHIPLVLTPLALIAVVVGVVRPSLRRVMEPLSIALLGASAILAQLAVNSGEALEGRLDHSPLIEHHAQLATTARTFIWVFFVFAVAHAVITKVIDRRSAGSLRSGRPLVRLGLVAVMLVGGIAANIAIIEAGHSGAKAVWYGTPSAGSDAQR